MNRAQQGRKTIKAWLKSRPCFQCGTRRASRVLARIDGGKVPSGMVNYSPARLAVRLAEYRAVCCSCIHLTPERKQDAKDLLLSGVTQLSTAQQLRMDVRTARRIAHELRANGATCLCGKPLSHKGNGRGLCNAVASVPAAAPVAPAADPTRCKEKPCPFPPTGNGFCKHHNQIFSLPESLTDSSLDFLDYARTPTNPSPRLSLVTLSDVRRGQRVWVAA